MDAVDALRRLVPSLLLPLIAVACGAPSTPLPPYATRAGLLARDICFGVEHLPGDFEIMARQIIDNATAAQRDTPSLRPAELQSWQRLSGAWLQEAYEPPSMPLEDADGFLTQDELEQALARAHAERLQAPFIAASCRLDLFATAQGAETAYRALAEAAPGLTLPHRRRGETSRLLVAPAALPGFARLTLWFRLENILASVSVTAPCDPHQPESCRQARDRAESLAALLLRRIATRVPGIRLPPAPSAFDSRGNAELLCPERDYTTCVAEVLTRIDTERPAVLCVSPYGQWELHSIASRESTDCPDDWTIAAQFAPRQTAP